MVPSFVFLFLTLLAVTHCSTIPDQPQTSPEVHEVPSSTGQPDKTTRAPHTHDEHPKDDDDHSDHDHPEHDHSTDEGSDRDHVEEPKESKTDEDDHDHPGHDHSASGHPHSDDHTEDVTKVVAETEKPKVVAETEKPVPSEEPLKKTEEPQQERPLKRLDKRAVWRRRLD